ncbi:hypothetical protein B296_00047458 [Ensete ventricosum]|uniref:Uncharacterized protein n=1 Tax=Ensete ventricosum TaxID=4639 RepID=A0A426WX92_ENSVE|nr:hypothetical protein B296_00047458 [Ensete ventricosum]
MHELGRYEIMVCTIPASAWTWLVRPRKASAVTMNDAGLDAGEGNPGSVIILQKRLGVGTATVASSVGRGCSGIGRNLGVRLGKSTAGVVERGSEGGSICQVGTSGPARRSGRVGSRRDPSDDQVSSVVGFYDPPVP